MQQLKPKHRSVLHIWAWIQVCTFKRSLEWITDKKKYASSKGELPLAHLIYTHRTPLYRRLRDVDIEMQRNKVTNLKIAIKQLNNLIIYPGEVLSYWKSIARPTKRKGYVDGMILHYGKVTAGVGGAYATFQIWFTRAHSPSPSVIDIAMMPYRTLDVTNRSVAEQHVHIIISIYKSRIRQHELINCFYI